jgi:hypothetical protein
MFAHESGNEVPTSTRSWWETVPDFLQENWKGILSNFLGTLALKILDKLFSWLVNYFWE